MRGQVLGVDKRSGEGQIAGDDGNRYVFHPDDWSDSNGPAIGLQVDFSADSGRAIRIFRVPGTHPIAPPPSSSVNSTRIIAALLAFFLGVLGVHKFYLGKAGAGLIMLLCGTIGWLLVLPGLFSAFTAFIEFITYLVTDDETFDQRYIRGNKNWF